MQGMNIGDQFYPLLLFIIYVNDILSNIQCGIRAPHVLKSNVAGIMFVDELHIISLQGLIAIIESIITDCSKEGILINLSKSKLILSRSQALQNAEFLPSHPILNYFREIHQTGI